MEPISNGCMWAVVAELAVIVLRRAVSLCRLCCSLSLNLLSLCYLRKKTK